MIKANEIRQQVKDSFVREREKSVSMLDSDKAKQKRYLSLKLEGILDSAINICVTYDPTRFGPFVSVEPRLQKQAYIACVAQFKISGSLLGLKELESVG